MMKFGEILAELRKENGLTQKQLAAKIGTSQAVLSHWEIGKFQPDLDTVCRLADTLKVSADYLLGRVSVEYVNNENITIKLTPEEAELLRKFRALTKENKIRADSYLDFLQK